jgi:UvrB/uvrC motif/SnoaL-like domain
VCMATDSDPSIFSLESQLNEAVALEDYTRAAQLRDKIAAALHDTRVAVEYANSQFYRAFRASDMQAMADIWGWGDHVQCIHPGSGCLAGVPDRQAAHVLHARWLRTVLCHADACCLVAHSLMHVAITALPLCARHDQPDAHLGNSQHGTRPPQGQVLYRAR